MRQNPMLLSAITASGVGVFLLVVIALHLAQPGYDPLNQLMSELALGRHGQFMLVAFLALAIALAAAALNLLFHGRHLVLAALLGLASASFAGAGWVTLGSSAAVHVGFVAAAFVLCGLSMYLLPAMVAAFSALRYRFASWGAGAAMTVSVTLGDSTLAPGLAQRLAAAALLGWLVMVAWGLARKASAQPIQSRH